MRTPIVVANWKMHKTAGEAVSFADALLPLVQNLKGIELAIAPAFTALDRLARTLGGSAIGLAAQNLNPESQGAFTGEVSGGMLRELGCRYVIVGHSERRALYGETNGFVARKAAAAFAHGLIPIVCVGETLADREAGRAEAVVAQQTTQSLAALPPARAAELVVAYEPVWAIGTGRTATPEIAQEMHAAIRAQLRSLFGRAAADRIRIQYGGSVKPDNAAQLIAQSDIDGALVGGASLEANSFARIASAIAPQEQPE